MNQFKKQRDQMGEFHALWAIFGCPWALFYYDLLTVWHFLGQAYFITGDFRKILGTFSFLTSGHSVDKLMLPKVTLALLFVNEF